MGPWEIIRGVRPSVPPSPRPVILPAEEDAPIRPAAAPSFDLDGISGIACQIVYRDSKGRSSERRVSCQRLDLAASVLYLHAYCHERGAYRQFRADRVVMVVDLGSGEIFDPGILFFERFSPDREQEVGTSWGLPPKRKATLLAGLNVLAFLARCDGRLHELEMEEIETFAARYWLRAELPGDPPMDVISERVASLRPDVETFYVSLDRTLSDRVMSGILARSAQAVIEADGFIHEKENYWGGEVLSALQEAGA